MIRHAHSRELYLGHKNAGQRVMAQGPPPQSTNGFQEGHHSTDRAGGPVSYVIKITDGRLWKRHADQIRGMLDSPENSSTPTIVEQPPVSDSRTPTTPPKSATSDDHTTVPPTSPSVSTPTDQSSQEDSAQPRYPVRVRGPPKRLTYDSSFKSSL